MFCRLRRTQQILQEGALPLFNVKKETKRRSASHHSNMSEAVNAKVTYGIWNPLSAIVQVFRGIPVNAEVLGKMGFLGSSCPKVCAVGGSWREVLGRQLERKVGKDASWISERPIYC